MMTLLRRSLWRALALIAIAICMATAAHGHAVVLGTVPTDGAVLERSPDHLTIRFNEPITPVSAQVLDAAGRDITPDDAVSVSNRELRIALPPSLSRGSYIASYRVVSIDSHPVSGSFIFSVGTVSAQPPIALNLTQDSGWRVAMAAARTAMYACILGGAGGLLFLLLVGPASSAAISRTTRISATFSALGVFAAMLAIGIQGGLLAGGHASSLGRIGTWRLGLQSGFGTTAVAAMFGLLLVAVALTVVRGFGARILACLGAATALAGFAMSGHVVTAGPRWITVPALLAHTTAVAFWVGSLLPLYGIVNSPGAESAAAVRRFSRIAVASVAVLVLAGLVIAVLQVRSLAGLVDTAYGRFLLCKLGLVAGLLTLAALNKWRLTPALALGKPRARSILRRSIAAEIALVFAIMALTAALSTTPPPRVLLGMESHAGHMDERHGARRSGISLTIVSGGRSAEIVLRSGQSGINAAEIRLLDGAGAPLTVQEVTLTAANPSAEVEPIRRVAEPAGPQTWRVGGLLLVPAGEWTVEIDALVNDFEKAVFEATVDLR